MVHGEATVIGKFLDSDTYGPHIYVNHQGKRIGADYGSNNVIEVLTTTAGCPLFWVPYTGGNPLPVGAVAGGYLSSGKVTYIAQKGVGSIPTFGYYNTDTEFIYYEFQGVQYSTAMEILVLI